VIVHVPVERSVALDPLTVQTPGEVLANETARPLDAEATSPTGPWSTRVSAGAGKVMVCASGAGVTWNECDTVVAAA
jgi:hypothetical protein